MITSALIQIAAHLSTFTLAGRRCAVRQWLALRRHYCPSLNASLATSLEMGPRQPRRMARLLSPRRASGEYLAPLSRALALHCRLAWRRDVAHAITYAARGSQLPAACATPSVFKHAPDAYLRRPGIRAICVFRPSELPFMFAIQWGWSRRSWWQQFAYRCSPWSSGHAIRPENGHKNLEGRLRSVLGRATNKSDSQQSSLPSPEP